MKVKVTRYARAIVDFKEVAELDIDELRTEFNNDSESLFDNLSEPFERNIKDFEVVDVVDVYEYTYDEDETDKLIELFENEK